MVKAQITTPAGLSVTVHGTPAEIRAVVQDLERKSKKIGHSREKAKSTERGASRITLGGLLQSLRDEGFFKEPRKLGTIKAELDAKGHIKPVTTLSGVVLGEVRKGNLRRVKKDDRWFYVRAG